jgi:hypothetical protein
MATVQGTELARSIRQKLGELKKACSDLDDATASRAPEGRWSPKEILSHLCGPEGSGHLPLFQAYLKKLPQIDIHPGDPFFTDHRRRMSLSDYLIEVDKEYNGIAAFAENLSEEELRLTAYVPQLKDSPLGDHPSLEKILRGIGDFHLQSHIDHLHEILQELRK